VKQIDSMCFSDKRHMKQKINGTDHKAVEQHQKEQDKHIKKNTFGAATHDKQRQHRLKQRFTSSRTGAAILRTGRQNMQETSVL
jgi:hypothetical protein